jgi:transcriptional regulator with XRE-family HTH domain
MTNSTTLVTGIKLRLRAHGWSYRQFAQRLGLSEPTVKRDLSRGRFSLTRLDRICEVLGVDILDLLQPPGTAPLTELSEAQELALVENPRLLLVTYLVVNNWKVSEIINTFRLEQNDLVNLLLKLDRLRIIDYRPPVRIKKLTARNFSWRKDGPVHAYFIRRVIPEFFDSRFEAPGDEFRFVGGMLSEASLLRLRASLRHVASEFESLAQQDARLPLEERDGCTAILALRSWEFSEFANLRRSPRVKRAKS